MDTPVHRREIPKTSFMDGCGAAADSRCDNSFRAFSQCRENRRVASLLLQLLPQKNPAAGSQPAHGASPCRAECFSIAGEVTFSFPAAQGIRKRESLLRLQRLSFQFIRRLVPWDRPRIVAPALVEDEASSPLFILQSSDRIHGIHVGFDPAATRARPEPVRGRRGHLHGSLPPAA